VLKFGDNLLFLFDSTREANTRLPTTRRTFQPLYQPVSRKNQVMTNKQITQQTVVTCYVRC